MELTSRTRRVVSDTGDRVFSVSLIFPAALLALFLAVSPIFLLGDAPGSAIVSRDYLTEAQVDTLSSLDLARAPADVRAGKATVNLVEPLGSGALLLAGTWEGELNLDGTPIESAGGRDVFLAVLLPSGSWQEIHHAGSSGDDSASVMSTVEDYVVLLGVLNGDAEFGEYDVEHSGGWAITAYEAHLKLGEGWVGTWEIDRELLPEDEPSLWCGF